MSSSSSDEVLPVYESCWCPTPLRPKLRVSWEPKTPGRRFYNCPVWPFKKQCLFFEWIDHLLNKHYRDLMLKLKSESDSDLHDKLVRSKEEVAQTQQLLMNTKDHLAHTESLLADTQFMLATADEKLAKLVESSECDRVIAEEEINKLQKQNKRLWKWVKVQWILLVVLIGMFVQAVK